MPWTMPRISTLLPGWQLYKNHPDARLRARYAREVAPLRSTYAGAVWAMKQYYRDSRPMFGRMKTLLGDIYREFGWKTRLSAPVIGLYAYLRLLQEERRLDKGWRYEPATFFDHNPAAAALRKHRKTSRVQGERHAAPPLAAPEPVLKQ